MGDTAAGLERLDVGRVIVLASNLIRRNGLVALGLSVVLVITPALLLASAGFGLMALEGVGPWGGEGFGLFNFAGMEPDPWLGDALAVSWGAGLIVAVVSSFVLLAAFIHCAVSDLDGRRAGFASSLGAGFRRSLPLIAAGIGGGLIIALGLVMLVVPGVIFVLMWLVTPPAIVVERIGILSAFRRSHRLTKGRRWALLVLLILFLVFLIVVRSVLELAAFLITVGFEHFIYAMIFFSPVSRAIGLVVGAAGLAALYRELRRIEHGGDGAADWTR